ncbi:MAG: hypothetical protein CM15mV143_200 [Caudoviricetes sp.]|nr:MAG: hypothetical protein CM15mV143_200 [Caudoviricetes sp.]
MQADEKGVIRTKKVESVGLTYGKLEILVYTIAENMKMQ